MNIEIWLLMSIRYLLKMLILYISHVSRANLMNDKESKFQRKPHIF